MSSNILSKLGQNLTPEAIQSKLQTTIERIRGNAHSHLEETWSLKARIKPKSGDHINDYCYLPHADIRAYISQIVGAIRRYSDVINIPRPSHYRYDHSEYSLTGLASSIKNLGMITLTDKPHKNIYSISPIQEAYAFGDIDDSDIQSIIEHILRVSYRDLKTTNEKNRNPEYKRFIKLLACMCGEATTQILEQRDIEAMRTFYSDLTTYFQSSLTQSTKAINTQEKTA